MTYRARGTRYKRLKRVTRWPPGVRVRFGSFADLLTLKNVIFGIEQLDLARLCRFITQYAPSGEFRHEKQRRHSPADECCKGRLHLLPALIT